jgi:hypothetical protein
VILPVTVEGVPSVVTVNVPVVAPDGTVIVAGTVALAFADVNATGNPPTGAGLEMVTVPVDGKPPGTEVGFRLSAVTVGGVTVSVALCGPPSLAVINTVLELATAELVTVKVAVV